MIRLNNPGPIRNGGYMRDFRLYVLSSILLFPVLSGCGSSKPASLEERVLDGVRMKTYTANWTVPSDPFRVVKSTTFGTDQGENTYFFSSAYPVGVAEDGTVIIRDGRTRMIHRFSPEGKHLGAFGGEGHGPGEFDRVTHAVTMPEEVLVWDSNLSRVSRFDITGNLTSVISPGSAEYFPGRLSRIIPIHPDPQARLIAFSAYGINDAPTPPAATYESHFHAYLLDHDLKVVSTLMDTFRTFETAALGSGNSHNYLGPPVYGRVAVLHAAAPDLPFVWTWNKDYTIEFMDLDNGERWSATILKPVEPVTSDLRELEYARWTDSGLEEQARRYIVFADHLPLIGYLLWDSAGRLWVNNDETTIEEPDSYTYEVFSTDGDWLFHQTLPERAFMFTANGFFSGSEAPDGSPLIQFHELVER